ncbi:hypothetical protein BG004_000004 [Podila humilis]|nr:hypothetical protein BG004_000004 [Podila humilis]
MFKPIITSATSVTSATAVTSTTSGIARRAFSAAAAQQHQFIVIARDYKDEDALKRRNSVRPSHLVDATELKKSGKLQLGGALLTNHGDSGKMIGSVMIFEAESEEEVVKIVEKDHYVTGKVWENYQIIPFRAAKF